MNRNDRAQRDIVVLQLRQRGHTLEHIGERFGLSKSGVAAILRRHDMPARPRRAPAPDSKAAVARTKALNLALDLLAEASVQAEHVDGAGPKDYVATPGFLQLVEKYLLQARAAGPRVERVFKCFLKNGASLRRAQRQGRLS